MLYSPLFWMKRAVFFHYKAYRRSNASNFWLVVFQLLVDCAFVWNPFSMRSHMGIVSTALNIRPQYDLVHTTAWNDNKTAGEKQKRKYLKVSPLLLPLPVKKAIFSAGRTLICIEKPAIASCRPQVCPCRSKRLSRGQKTDAYRGVKCLSAAASVSRYMSATSVQRPSWCSITLLDSCHKKTFCWEPLYHNRCRHLRHKSLFPYLRVVQFSLFI